MKTFGVLLVSGIVSGAALMGAGLFTGREVPSPEIVYVTVTPTPTPAWEPERLIATRTPILNTTTSTPVATATPTPLIPSLPPTLPPLPVLTPTPSPFPIPTPEPTATPCVPGRSQARPPAHGFCQ